MNYIKEISAYNKDDNTVNGIIEILQGSTDKNELIGPLFNKLHCVRKISLEYPFYYGSFPQTLAGDNDPLDMILFTDKNHNLLDVVKVDIIGAVKTIDEGQQDDKIICVETDCGLLNVKKQMKAAMKFLKKYKGPNADMLINKKLASMKEAEALVAQAKENWDNSLKVNVATTPTQRNIQSSDKRIRVIQK